MPPPPHQKPENVLKVRNLTISIAIGPSLQTDCCMLLLEKVLRRQFWTVCDIDQANSKLIHSAPKNSSGLTSHKPLSHFSTNMSHLNGQGIVRSRRWNLSWFFSSSSVLS